MAYSLLIVRPSLTLGGEWWEGHPAFPAGEQDILLTCDLECVRSFSEGVLVIGVEDVLLISL